MAHISDIKLIRTDTTLDLSQKAEKASLEHTKIRVGNEYGLSVKFWFFFFFISRKIDTDRREELEEVEDVKQLDLQREHSYFIVDREYS
ncbi:hypothetical protein MKW98_022975 [Papaver atlanticum]|uniref:Uncharacterized protein n=1 Tax=Papaver atlanticum TaxID=357466 RepID=A0AAD4XT76_9MAGN|nr:hypothetical protein MKW98_022975 [Papaver atlanticum]